MKMYRKIDNNGFFLEDIFMENIEDGQELFYISAMVPQGLYLPNWDGTKWIEGMTKEEIDNIKNETIEQPLVEKNRADIEYLAIMTGVDL